MDIKYKTYWRKTGLKGKWGDIFLELIAKHNPKTFLEIGCAVGYLLNWEEEINGYPEGGIEVNNLDYNIHVGFDYKLTKKLYLNTRLSNSITPIRKHASEQTYRWNKGQYNTNLSFILYYYIGNSKN